MALSIIDCSDLDEFWNTVSPIGATFATAGGRFVYRGQADAGWELVPKVYRQDVIDEYKFGPMPSFTDHRGQVLFEWWLLHSFIRYCDATGLTIPNDSVEFRRYLEIDRVGNTFATNTRDWPQDRVIGALALAQHHGLPTRLLDWCARPYVACYFAAASAIASRQVDATKRLAVFGLDLKTIHPDPGLRHVRVPGSTSAYLAVQGGSFILVENSGYTGDDFTPGVSVESKLGGTAVSLIKVTLPQPLAPELLRRCQKFGISAATVFPGYDGAGKAVKELSYGEVISPSSR